MNKAKRKLLISVLVMMFILISVVATVAIIFAATQQTITTTLNMTYTAENIYGSVKGSYSLGGVTENLTASTGGTDLVFQGKPLQNGALSFPTEQLDMSSEASELILKYDFTNSGRRHYIATMSFESVIDPYNMKVQYSIDGDVYSDQRYAVVVQDDTTRSYWIKISVENKADNASFKGDFIWNLEDTEDMDEATYLSLSSLEFQEVKDFDDNIYESGAYSVKLTSTGDYIGKLVFPREINGDKVTTIIPSSLTSEEKKQITSIYIPDTVETIQHNAFYNFTNLEEVIFEQNEAAGSSSVSAQSTTGLKKIGLSAFAKCTSLEEFIFPDTVETILSEAFWSCSGLKKIFLGASLPVTDLPSIFMECASLEILEVSSENDTYYSVNNCIIQNQEVALGCKTSKIPDDGSVTSIGVQAFWFCENLKEIVIPSSITEIGAEAFIECPNLKNITLHTLNDSVVSHFAGMIDVIGDVNLTIDTVTEIPAYILCNYEFSGLKSITVSDSVKTIGFPFVYCFENLETVRIGKGVTSFSEQNMDTGLFDGCVKLTSIVVSEENPIYKSEGNCIINKSTKTLIAGCKSSVIPEDGSVEKIGTFAFSGMTELTSIIIPNSVEEIGDFAFAITGLVSIKIPFSVVKIGMCAFFETNSVENIIFENTEGWQCDGNSIPEEQLSDSSNAAQMLKSDEYSGIWTRSE